MSQQLLNILQSYWGIIVVILGFISYFIYSKENAKQIILSLMIRIEKDAENLSIKTGDEKLSFVVNKGYSLLPPIVRAVVTEEMFQAMAIKLYDNAKKYLQAVNEEK